MNHRALEMRLQDLEDRLVILHEKIQEAKKAEAERSVIGDLMMKYTAVEAQMGEIRAWQKADEKDPKYGTQVRVNGMWRPRLPVFGSVDEALEAMNSPDGGFGATTRAIAAARAWRAERDAQETVYALDGRSPLLPEDERKPFNTTL